MPTGARVGATHSGLLRARLARLAVTSPWKLEFRKQVAGFSEDAGARGRPGLCPGAASGRAVRPPLQAAFSQHVPRWPRAGLTPLASDSIGCLTFNVIVSTYSNFVF